MILRVNQGNALSESEGYVNRWKKMNLDLLEGGENSPIDFGLAKMVGEHKGTWEITKEDSQILDLFGIKDTFSIYNIPYQENDGQINGTIILERPWQGNSQKKYRVGFETSLNTIPNPFRIKAFLHALYSGAKQEALAFRER